MSIARRVSWLGVQSIGSLPELVNALCSLGAIEHPLLIFVFNLSSHLRLPKPSRNISLDVSDALVLAVKFCYPHPKRPWLNLSCLVKATNRCGVVEN